MAAQSLGTEEAAQRLDGLAALLTAHEALVAKQVDLYRARVQHGPLERLAPFACELKAPFSIEVSIGELVLNADGKPQCWWAGLLFVWAVAWFSY
jgi:hypothetical protein